MCRGVHVLGHQLALELVRWLVRGARGSGSRNEASYFPAQK
jgi:hypothetical protein